MLTYFCFTLNTQVALLKVRFHKEGANNSEITVNNYLLKAIVKAGTRSIGMVVLSLEHYNNGPKGPTAHKHAYRRL